MDLNNLKKEIPFQWRVQSFTQKNAVCVAYIDSRDVQTVLDEVVGVENWQCDYKEVKGNLFCGIGILINNQWTWKWDCGTESNTEKEKGEASDSFKRAAVKWGVGRFLYNLEIVRIGFTENNGKKYPCNKANEILWSGDDLTKYINGLKNNKPVNLHNHKEIVKNNLPLISNKWFKQACEKIEKGELEIYWKVKADFSMTKEQEDLLTQLYNKAKKVPA